MEKHYIVCLTTGKQICYPCFYSIGNETVDEEWVYIHENWKVKNEQIFCDICGKEIH